MTLLSTFCGLLLLVQASATGTVSGRITDEQGQPAVDVNWCGLHSTRRAKRFRPPVPRMWTTVAITGSTESHRAAIICSLAILRDPRAAGAAEWPFDSRVCVELLSRCDGRQPGSADRSEEWI